MSSKKKDHSCGDEYDSDRIHEVPTFLGRITTDQNALGSGLRARP